MTISHAIATAVNTVKRWCSGGSVSKTSGPHVSNVSAKTKAKACAAVAQWEAKKAKAKVTEAYALIEAEAEAAELTAEQEAELIDFLEAADSPAIIEGVTPMDVLRNRARAKAQRERELSEGLKFDPRLHPRDREGQFRNAIGKLKLGQSFKLPGGGSVTRTGEGFRYQPGTSSLLGNPSFKSVDDVAAHAARFAEPEGGTRPPSVSPQLSQAFNEWVRNKVYLDNGGNYRNKETGKVTPWNREVHRVYGRGDSSAFEHDATEHGHKRGLVTDERLATHRKARARELEAKAAARQEGKAAPGKRTEAEEDALRAKLGPKPGWSRKKYPPVPASRAWERPAPGKARERWDEAQRKRGWADNREVAGLKIQAIGGPGGTRYKVVDSSGKVVHDAPTHALAEKFRKDYGKSLKKGKGKLKESSMDTLRARARARAKVKLDEAATLTFDPRLHPRDRIGRFTDVLKKLAKGENIKLRAVNPHDRFGARMSTLDIVKTGKNEWTTRGRKFGNIEELEDYFAQMELFPESFTIDKLKAADRSSSKGRPLPVGMSLPGRPRDSLDVRQQLAYKEIMGREWKDDDPRPEDFGGPPSPPNASFEVLTSAGRPLSTNPNAYPHRPGKSTKARLADGRVVSYDEASRIQRQEWAEYDKARKAWEASPDYERYKKALKAWAKRRQQFAYTGKKKGDEDVLAATKIKEALCRAYELQAHAINEGDLRRAQHIRFHASVLQEALTLDEARVDFDPRLHPRDRLGRFRDILGKLGLGDSVDLPEGITVKRVASHGFEVHKRGEARGLGAKRRATSVGQAAQMADNLSGSAAMGQAAPGDVKRYALVTGDSARVVARYLPENYQVEAELPEGVVISGRDSAGWTLDGYVRPRLASGNMGSEEIDLSHPVMKKVPVRSGKAVPGEPPDEEDFVGPDELADLAAERADRGLKRLESENVRIGGGLRMDAGLFDELRAKARAEGPEKAVDDYIASIRDRWAAPWDEVRANLLAALGRSDGQLAPGLGPRKHLLLTQADRAKLPPLYSQEGKGDETIAPVKFFSPYSGWTFYATEFDGEDTFFGWSPDSQMVGGGEWGYASLSEMEGAMGMGGRLPLIERDKYWQPKSIGAIKADPMGKGSPAVGRDRYVRMSTQALLAVPPNATPSELRARASELNQRGHQAIDHMGPAGAGTAELLQRRAQELWKEADEKEGKGSKSIGAIKADPMGQGAPGERPRASEGWSLRGQAAPGASQRQQEISDATGFDNGDLFDNADDVRAYFQASAQRDMFGDDAIIDQDVLDAMANDVIEHGWHMRITRLPDGEDAEPGTVDYSALWREDASFEERVALFQELVNSGQAWHLEGAVGREAMDLIEGGYIMLGEKRRKDYWGNTVPSRYDVEPGTKGSAEYVDAMRGARGQAAPGEGSGTTPGEADFPYKSPDFPRVGKGSPAMTGGSFAQMIESFPPGTKSEVKVNGITFEVYYDEQPALGDDGMPVSGDVVGSYEAWLGNKNIARIHVSPHGTSGYGNPRAKAYAAEQVAERILAAMRERKRFEREGKESPAITGGKKSLVISGPSGQRRITTAAEEKAAAWRALLDSPFKATHEYHPGLMDLTDPNVIEGSPIRKGAPVRIVRGGRGQEKVDPLGKIVWVQDDQGNVQSVWKAALQRPGKASPAVVDEDVVYALDDDAALTDVLTDADAEKARSLSPGQRTRLDDEPGLDVRRTESGGYEIIPSDTPRSGGESEPEIDYASLNLSELAAIIARDWNNVNFAAVPYLDAMRSLRSVRDNYMAESGKTVVSYFLSNASQWKGPRAKAIKAELKKRLREAGEVETVGIIERLEEAVDAHAAALVRRDNREVLRQRSLVLSLREALGGKCPECGMMLTAGGKEGGKCHNPKCKMRGKKMSVKGVMEAAGARQIEERDFSQGQREALAKKGKALPGGGYPIVNEQDLRNAIQAIGRAKDRAATIAHIKSRAKALGLTKLLPDDWR